MNRDATYQDTPLIEAMLREMLAGSKYAGRASISEKAMRDLLVLAVNGQRQHGPQATLVRIAEERGKPVGFIIGTLSRAYYVLDRLAAQDLYLYVRPGVRPTHLLHLIDDYIGWAQANRKVIEINLSWTDAMPGAERIGPLYERKGFARIGGIYEMRLDRDVKVAA